jgi:hypothetical protein
MYDACFIIAKEWRDKLYAESPSDDHKFDGNYPLRREKSASVDNSSSDACLGKEEDVVSHVFSSHNMLWKSLPTYVTVAIK